MAQPRARTSQWSASTLLIVRLLAGRGVLLEKSPNRQQFVWRRLVRRQRLHDELRHRSTERTVQEVAQELLLRVGLAGVRAIGVLLRSDLLARREALFRHHLQQLERRGVAERPVARQVL